ncbi:hypothetical protein DFJ73DRAFT_784529 [Zopfochytrium polystomum]|nr:hypothetical protein DFJ73DRAFT_784529 [Zopfochytrium polystomum]
MAFNFLADHVKHACSRGLGGLSKTAFPSKVTDDAGVAAVIDISGFTALTSNLQKVHGNDGAARLRDLISAPFEKIIQKVVGTGGSVVKFAGDSAVVCWSDTDESVPNRRQLIVQAFACCLDLLLSFQPGKVSPPARSGLDGADADDIGIHIGLGFGALHHIYIGENGTRPLRRDYLVAGPSVQEAGEILNISKRGDLAVSRSFMANLTAAMEALRVVDVGLSSIAIAEHAAAFVMNGSDAALARVLSRLKQHQLHAEKLESPRSAEEWNAALTFIDESVAKTLGPWSDDYADEQRASPPHRAHAWEDALKLYSDMRNVTVAFIRFLDIDLNDPADLARAQRAFLATVRTVRTFGGCLRQFNMDDKGFTALVVWGLKGFAHERNESKYALQAMLSVRLELSRLSIGAFRVGVAAGKVYAGLIGGNLRMDGTVLGSAVNYAARLMCVPTPESCILVDGVAQTSCESDFVFSRLNGIKLKGFAEVSDSFVLVEETTNKRTKAQELVGREQELSDIRRVVERWTQENETSCRIFISGRSGFGKSALLRHTAEHLVSSPYVIVTTSSTSQEARKSFQEGLMESKASLGDADSDVGASPVSRYMMDLVKAMRLPALECKILAGVPGLGVNSGREALNLSPAEYSSSESMSCIALNPMSHEDVRNLIRRLWENQIPLEDDVVLDVYNKSQGVPIAVGMIIRLESRRYGTKVFRKGRNFAVSENTGTALDGTISAQMDSLSEDFQELVRVAAVCGQYFDLETVTGVFRVVKRSEEDFRKRLLRLIEEEDRYGFFKLLNRDSASYSFCHYLVHQGVLASMLPRTKDELNRAVVTHYEGLLTRSDPSLVLPLLIQHLIKLDGEQGKKERYLFDGFVLAAEKSKIEEALSYSRDLFRLLLILYTLSDKFVSWRTKFGHFLLGFLYRSAFLRYEHFFAVSDPIQQEPESFREELYELDYLLLEQTGRVLFGERNTLPSLAMCCRALDKASRLGVEYDTEVKLGWLAVGTALQDIESLVEIFRMKCPKEAYITQMETFMAPYHAVHCDFEKAKEYFFKLSDFHLDGVAQGSEDNSLSFVSCCANMVRAGCVLLEWEHECEEAVNYLTKIEALVQEAIHCIRNMGPAAASTFTSPAQLLCSTFAGLGLFLAEKNLLHANRYHTLKAAIPKLLDTISRTSFLLTHRLYKKVKLGQYTRSARLLWHGRAANRRPRLSAFVAAAERLLRTHDDGLTEYQVVALRAHAWRARRILGDGADDDDGRAIVGDLERFDIPWEAKCVERLLGGGGGGMEASRKG